MCISAEEKVKPYTALACGNDESKGGGGSSLGLSHPGYERQAVT